MLRRKVLGVTGIRSDYDILAEVFREITLRPELELELVVLGAHLSEFYGGTVKEIEADGFKIADEIISLFNSNSLQGRAKGLGVQIQGLAQSIARIKPDVILVLGDREESIAAALAGAYLEIPVAHIAGGDRVVGNVDDQVRHAVSKLSQIHFATNSESAARLIKMGEQEFRVFDTGNPGLDRFLRISTIPIQEIFHELGLEWRPDEKYILLIQHVISSEADYAYQQMAESLRAVEEFGVNTLVIYPNSDAGSMELIRAIQDFKHVPNLAVVRNIRRDLFVNLMRGASCLLGNSSAGIMEAPLLKLPVVNVGNRQKGRLHAENIIFVPHEKAKIISALKSSLYDSSTIRDIRNCRSPYGDGHSAVKIARIIAEIPFDENLRQKDMTY